MSTDDEYMAMINALKNNQSIPVSTDKTNITLSNSSGTRMSQYTYNGDDHSSGTKFINESGDGNN